MHTRIEVLLVIERVTLREQRQTLMLHCASDPGLLTPILTGLQLVESLGTYKEPCRILIKQSRFSQHCLKPTTTAAQSDTTSAMCKALSQTSTLQSKSILILLSHSIYAATFLSP